MKGMFFKDGVEYRLHIGGESWRQGDMMKGVLKAQPEKKKPQLIFCLGVLKKIKGKPLGDSSLDEAFGSKTPMNIDESGQWQWPISLDATISDKKMSPYFLYGPEGPSSQMGALELKILPHQHVEDFVNSIETAFRFTRKQVLAKEEGFSEFKLIPPDGQQFRTMEHALVILRYSGDAGGLEGAFEFQVKGIDASAGLKIKKNTSIFPISLKKAEILHSFNQRVNREAVESVFSKALLELKPSQL